MKRPKNKFVQLPEYDNPMIERLPPLLSQEEALGALANPPAFHPDERHYPAHIRAHCIQRLAHYFEPLDQHLQLEAMFAALIRQGYVGRSFNSIDFQQRVQNAHERVKKKELKAYRHPLRSTASSIALIGCSGVGKTASIERVLQLYPPVIHHDVSYSLDQLVWVKLDCPYIGSPGQLCISFFKEIDGLLGTCYWAMHGNSRTRVDEMMAHMANVASLHAVGVLIIDEIQHLCAARGTGPEAMPNFLVTLVNKIGIPVMMIGTLAALPLLQGDFRQARRASGFGSLVWERMEDGPVWRYFVERMWRFQWTQEVTPLTEEIHKVLYEESQGIVDIVIKLFMLTQLRAIALNLRRGRPEQLDVGLLKQVAQESFQIIRPMIDALKRGDREAIAKYNDIRPLQDHIQQKFSDALTRWSPAPLSRVATDAPAPSSVSDSKTEEGQIYGALAALGVARDIAKILLAEAKAANPGLAIWDLVASIADKLRLHQTEVKPVKRRQSLKKKPTVEPDDIRTIVAQGKNAGLSGHKALLQAGIVEPSLIAFPL